MAWTHRHVRHAEAVKHVVVRILELGQVDVFLDVLVLGTKLGKATLRVEAIVEGGGQPAVGRPGGRYCGVAVSQHRARIGHCGRNGHWNGMDQDGGKDAGVRVRELSTRDRVG